MENNFDKLLKATEKHLSKKRYLYKPEIKERNEDDTVKLDDNGNEIYKKTSPTPHKNVMLSIAFNIALKNYLNIRPSNDFRELKATEITDMLLRYFSNKFVDKIGESILINTNQNYQYEAIERFRKIEYKLFTAVERLRNYHSHYVHEPGILTFTDLFENGKSLSTDDFDEAKKWFEKKFDLAKSHLVNSLTNKKEFVKIKEDSYPIQKEKYTSDQKEINKTLEKFKHLNFLEEDNKTISLNGQLFIASMFLYKRQIKIVLEKWRDFRLDKELTGYGNSIHTFFTYYCMSESYSLNNFNDNLMKFRNITSKLTTIPFSSNSQLEPIYQKIREINEVNYKKIELFKQFKKNESELEKQKRDFQFNNFDKKTKGQLLTQIDNLVDNTDDSVKMLKSFIEMFNNQNTLVEERAYNLNCLNQDVPTKIKTKYRHALEKTETEIEKTDFQSKIMPIRRRNILTNVLLEYLLDNNLFGNNFKIAIAKTSVDRLEYFNDYNSDGISEKESLEELKNRIKVEKNRDAKNKLREHYKELKRNFFFKTPAELHDLCKPHTSKVRNSENEESEVTIVKGFKFANKEKNALLQYSYTPTGHQPVTINVVVSPQLLMKWVFVHLSRGDNEGLTEIEKFINMYINKLVQIKNIDSKGLVMNYLKFKKVDFGKELTSEFISEYNKKGHNLNKIFPRSIMQSAGIRVREIDINKTLNNRIELLEKFENNNRLHPKPWVYESKKKIDVILEYLHFKLLEDVYVNKINEKENEDAETFLRHTYFSINSYDIVRQYFRYFGRYENRTYDELKIYGTDKFLKTHLIETVKKKYADVFAYIENHIAKNYSLETLFEAVIITYIKDLKGIVLNRRIYTDETLYKVLKIDTGSIATDVDINLSTHYLKSIALSEEIISVKQSCNEQLKSIIDDIAGNGKKQFYTDYTFMRAWLLSKDQVTTNTDFILKHIIDENIRFEKNEKNKLIPNSVFKKLLKFKTEELILWQIARTYWYKANGKEYVLDDYMKNSNSSNYQVFTTFNKVYKQDLDYVVKIETSFWDDSNKAKFKKVLEKNPDITGKTVEIKLKVPAKRYDNQFLGVESGLIIEYCLWNHCKNNVIVLPSEYTYLNGNKQEKQLNLQVYDQLIKMIHIELNKSLGYIGSLLVSEKKLIDNSTSKASFHLRNKYENKAIIEDFYLTLTNKDSKNEYNKFIFDSFINDMNVMDQDKPDIMDYLVRFRNFALHYQLQDPIRSEKVNKLLKAINRITNKRDYYKEEKNIEILPNA